MPRGIRGGELVPPLADVLTKPATRPAALRVHTFRDRLKVLWIDAASHSAKVVELKASRDRPDELLVR